MPAIPLPTIAIRRGFSDVMVIRVEAKKKGSPIA